jgi:hypothetical protein
MNQIINFMYELVLLLSFYLYLLIYFLSELF